VNRVTIDLAVLRRNVRRIGEIMDEHGATWTLVTKVLCGHPETLRALPALDVETLGDSRLENLEAAAEAVPGMQRWYLRPPAVSAAQRIVDLAHVSMVTEIEALEALDRAAGRRGMIHRVIVVVEVGELREGVLPSALLAFARRAVSLPNIQTLGVGANIGCLSGTVPTIEQLSPLPLYRKLLELEFGLPVPLVSAGSSVVLSALLQGNVPAGINHYRIGEAAFLGTDILRGGRLEGLENAATLEAEILEIGEKNLVPLGEISEDVAPFGTGGDQDTTPGERGHRALVAIGQLDTDVNGLTPLDPEHTLVGASSDISVVNLGENGSGLAVGDTIRFRPDYSAFARAMNSRYLRREVTNARPEGGGAAAGNGCLAAPVRGALTEGR
jgi:predicted amino acid racemase